MRAPLSWIKEYAELPATAHGRELADRLAALRGWERILVSANHHFPYDADLDFIAHAPEDVAALAGHAGYRLALYNVEGDLQRGQRVKQGKRIGKVPTRGCERGDRLRMALYQPQKGPSDDPVAVREGVPPPR